MIDDAYRDDLAYIHDAGFGQVAQAAGPMLVDLLRRGGFNDGLVIDLGCGSGILSAAVSEAGFDVLGIDISRSMIALARQRVPRGQFRVESLLKTSLPPCVGVAAVGECLNYLFDQEHSLAGLSAFFQRVFDSLNPGGIFLFDVAEPGRAPAHGTVQRHFEGDGWAVLVTFVEDREQQLLTRKITSFRQVGTLYRRDQEVHRQRLLARSELIPRLREIGFRVRAVAHYGPLRLRRGHGGLVAHKPWPESRKKATPAATP